MKFFVAFAALVAVAIASPLVKPVNVDAAEIQEIIAAIQSPSTDPATAHLLEQMLDEIIAAAVQDTVAVGPALIEQDPISVGPVIIEHEPVSIGPAIIDFPLPDGGEVSAPVPEPVFTPVQPSPVVVGPIAPGSPAPLVQLIVNINQAADNVVMPVAPVVVPEIKPDPVIVVEEAEAPVDPISVVESAPEPIVVDPVQVVETAPVVVEPVIIGTPVLPSPAVILPEELN